MNVYVRELSRALAGHGVQVDVFTRRQSVETPEVVEIATGARLIHVDAGPRRHIDKYDVVDYLPEFTCGVQRWRALTGARYDLVHAHYWLSGQVGVSLARSWRVPLVAMFHTLAELKNRVAETAAEREQQARFQVERETMRRADRIVASTELDRAQILRHYPDAGPITIIPGGVDLDHFRPLGREWARRRLGISPRRPVILFVGRIQRLKGIEIAVRALAHLRGREPDLDPELRVVGGLPGGLERGTGHEQRELARLQRLAARLGVADHVRFVGAVQQRDLPLHYAAADLTVMPSSYESFGLVAVESLACGTPVVATRVGGLVTILRDGVTGRLVPWRDPRLFAEAMLPILQDGSIRERMAAAARESVLGFDWRQIAADHLGLYRAILREDTLATASVAAR